MGRFLGRFTFLLTLLLGLTLVPAVHERLVQPWTATVARVAVDLAGVLDPDVIASGDRIVSASSGFAVRIEAGCNGVEPTLMLLAAMLAFPAPWRHRLVGFAAGAVLVQLANLARILTLFYLGQWSGAVFDWAHLYVWPALIVLDALMVFLVWLRLLPRPARHTG